MGEEQEISCSRGVASEFKHKELKNYPKFVEVVQALKEFYELQQYSLRWIDRYGERFLGEPIPDEDRMTIADGTPFFDIPGFDGILYQINRGKR